MSLDLQGPANAPNFTTARPADTRVFGATDTWFKDCTSSAANDGTKLQAGWTNGILGQIRNLIRGNGNTAVPAPVVTEDNTDDAMLLKAVQYLIQRGQPIYAADSSTTIGTVTVSFTPAVVEYKTGMTLVVKMANDCIGANVINVNALGNKAIVKAPGAQPLVGGEWKSGDIVTLRYDGTNFQGAALGQRAPLTANVDLYVNPSTGSDTTLDGSAATVSGQHGPFATIQKALNIVGQFAPGTFGATIHLSASTHDQGTGIATAVSWAHCNVTIVGAGIGSTLMTGHGSGGAVLIAGPNYTLQSFSLSYTGSASGGAIVSGSNSTILNTIQFNGSSGTNIRFATGVTLTGTITLNGNCSGDMFNANAGSGIGFSGCTINAGGAPLTMSNFVSASHGGQVSCTPAPTFTGTGSLTGQKYSATSNAVIDSSGVTFPGTIAGTTGSGGQYI